MNVSREKVKKFLLFLLSHHTEEYAHRTLKVRFRGRELRLCARCSGLTIGFILGIIVQFYVWKWLYVPEPLAMLIVTLFLTPALVDWGTQSVLGRESKNWLRVATGCLLGFGIGFTRFIELLRLLLLVSFFYVVAVIIVFFRVKRGKVHFSEDYKR